MKWMLDILWKLALSKYNNSYCQWVNDTSVPLLTKIQLTKSNSAADTYTYTNTLIKRIWQFSPLKISLAREWFANIKEIECIHGNSEVKSLSNHWPIVSIVNIINPIECFRVVLVLTREHNSLNQNVYKLTGFIPKHTSHSNIQTRIFENHLICWDTRRLKCKYQVNVLFL